MVDFFFFQQIAASLAVSPSASSSPFPVPNAKLCEQPIELMDIKVVSIILLKSLQKKLSSIFPEHAQFSLIVNAISVSFKHSSFGFWLSDFCFVTLS